MPEIALKETATKRETIADEITAVSAIIERGGPHSAEEQAEVKTALRGIETKMDGQRERMHSFFRTEIQTKLEQLFPGDPLISLLKETTPLVNEIKLHVDGNQAFGAILRNIEAAKSSILINIYIWRDDDIGNAIANALLARADRGVKVTIRKDRGGALFEHAEQNKQSFFHKNINLMEKAKAMGIDYWYQRPDEADSSVQRENPLVEKLLHHQNIHVESAVRSDHSKYFVFDDRTIIIGGMNIGDESRTRWHDYMVEVRDSPLCVARLREAAEGKAHTTTSASAVEFAANRMKDGVMEKADIKPTVLSLLEQAKSEIIIEMAYFGDRDINAALIRAVRRKGVTVTVLLPELANVQDDLNKHMIAEIMRAAPGLTICLYPRMLHAKCLVVDRSAVFLGSANFNTTATMDLGETNILVHGSDVPFTRELLSQLSADIAQSKKVTDANQLVFDPKKAETEASWAAKDTSVKKYIRSGRADDRRARETSS